MVKRIYKYPTGVETPTDAVYLSTITQTKCYNSPNREWEKCWLVWHYFLVEVEDV